MCVVWDGAKILVCVWANIGVGGAKVHLCSVSLCVWGRGKDMCGCIHWRCLVSHTIYIAACLKMFYAFNFCSSGDTGGHTHGHLQHCSWLRSSLLDPAWNQVQTKPYRAAK